ncbi:hypothetical protein [Anaerotaenia torta]|uniref:hypothetical protein n=1 Tax=Anaerotaenia torta TaxID=433293 RepID=UPI003D1A6521
MRYHVIHPVIRLSINDIHNIQVYNETYNSSDDKAFIQEFLTAYNKAKLNKEQELGTTSDFVLIVNLTNGEFIKILDGDTTFCYMEYNGKSVVAYCPGLIKLIENKKK